MQTNTKTQLSLIFEYRIRKSRAEDRARDKYRIVTIPLDERATLTVDFFLAELA